MGTITKGILGGFNGKVGTVVGSKWKNKLVMRSAPGPRKGKPSKAQTEQQVKFSVMIKFLQPLTPLLELTYKKVAVGITSLNSTISDLAEPLLSFQVNESCPVAGEVQTGAGTFGRFIGCQ
jgi:hypothetical protein